MRSFIGDSAFDLSRVALPRVRGQSRPINPSIYKRALGGKSGVQSEALPQRGKIHEQGLDFVLV
jgi:hypothetical protein